MTALHEERIILHKTLAGQPKIKTVRRDQGERLRKEIWSDRGNFYTHDFVTKESHIWSHTRAQSQQTKDEAISENQKVCHLVCPNVFHCHNIL